MPIIENEIDATTHTSPLSVITYQLQLLHKDVVDVRSSLTKLTEALTKVAIIEERQGYSAQIQTQVLAELKQLNERLDKTNGRLAQAEISITGLSKQDGKLSGWLEKAIWAVIGLVAYFAAGRLGLLN